MKITQVYGIVLYQAKNYGWNMREQPVAKPMASVNSVLVEQRHSRL